MAHLRTQPGQLEAVLSAPVPAPPAPLPLRSPPRGPPRWRIWPAMPESMCCRCRCICPAVSAGHRDGSAHPRHLGCAGPVRLAPTRDRSGRTSRLADACTACAGATSHTAVVPDTLLGTIRPHPSPGPPSPARVGPHPETDDQVRVREMLTYLGAALPRFTSPRHPAVETAVRPARRRPRPCPAAGRTAARHATARAPGPVAGTRPHRPAGTAECQVDSRATVAARCRDPGPGARPPRPPSRRPLGTAPRSAGCAGGTAPRNPCGTSAVRVPRRSGSRVRRGCGAGCRCADGVGRCGG